MPEPDTPTAASVYQLRVVLREISPQAVPIATALACLGQVGAAEREEATQSLDVELRREPRQLLALSVRQEPDRHPPDPTTAAPWGFP